MGMKLDRREFIKSASVVGMLGMLGMFAPNLLLDRPTAKPAKVGDREGLLGENILRMNSEDIGTINSISMSMDRTIDQIDVTPLGASSYRDFAKGFETSAVNMRLVPTTKARSILRRGFETGESQSFELITGDTQFSFEGYITSTQSSAEEIEIKVMIDSSITVNTMTGFEVELV